MFWSTSKCSPVRASYVHERRTETHYPRLFDIGVAAGGVIFCVAALGVSLFASGGLIRFAEVAQHVVK
jgi:hypothetical protein